MPTPFRILHIDDNAFDRQLVRDALEQTPDQFILTEAASREDYELYLAEDSYDVVLTDFNILGFEGLQVIDAIHEKHPTTPVIVVTGTGSEEVAVEAMRRGASDYVIKTPKHIRRLPVAIQAAIERNQLQNERSQAEQALRASEERLRAFTKALPDLAFIVDDDGRFVQLLSAVEHHLYGEGERLVGKRIHDVLPEPIVEPILEAIHRTIETGVTQSVEYQIDLPDGSMWFEMRTSLMSAAPGGKALTVYIVRNITDRKVAELRLRRERNLLRTLIDNVPDHIFVIDRTGRFIANNTAHAAAAHLSPAELIGKTPLDVFLPDFARAFHGDDKKVMATGNALISEERLIQNISNNQWVLMTKVPLTDETGDVIGLVGIARDITSRKQTEDALRASEEHLRAIMAATPVIIFELDTRGTLTFLQGQGVNVLGGEPNIDVGNSILDPLGEFIPDIQERFRLALTGEETASIQTVGDMTLDIRYSPMRNKSGEISGIIGVATDIAERLKTERLRIELEKEQEIIALKERFIATASHDFRTPLTIIKMTVNMLETYYEQFSSEQRAAKLNQIDIQIDHMIQLLEDVLTMSKANSGKLDFNPTSVALRSFCEQIWDNFQRMAEKTHTMHFVYNADVDKVTLDPNLVQYILVNLLSNAIKYSPLNGVVRFEVANTEDRLIFRVSDNGIGIPEQDQAKLFEPFHRAANTKGIEGTGLGLSIVKSYVEAHHGSIEFQSQENQGSVFTVYIPLEIS